MLLAKILILLLEKLFILPFEKWKRVFNILENKINKKNKKNVLWNLHVSLQVEVVYEGLGPGAAPHPVYQLLVHIDLCD